jgi:hypothetical protein
MNSAINCSAARDTLELARPPETDAAAAEQAAQHVGGCPACQTAIPLRQHWDARLGPAIRDVSVPAGLKDRLLASLAAAPTVPTAQSTITTTAPILAARAPARRNRLKILAGGIAAACVLVAVGATVWLLKPVPPDLALETVTLQALSADQTQWSAFQKFQRKVPLALPGTMVVPDRKTGPMRFAQVDVAVYVFHIPERGKPPAEVRLLIMPTASVIDRPAAERFLAGPTPYKQGYRTTSWVEGKLTFVCCTTGGEQVLQQLQHRSA